MANDVVELAGFTVIGKGLDCPGYDASGIGGLWASASPQLAEMTPDGRMWGISLPGAGGFRYLAAVEQAQDAPVPDGLERHDVAGGRYMHLTFTGKPQEMQASFGALYGSLAEAGEKPVEGGPCLELYESDCWDEATGNLKAELYVPLA